MQGYRNRRRAGWATVALLCLLAHRASVSAATAPRYTVQELGTLGGATSRAFGINDAGQVVGSTTSASNGSRAFRWTKGTMLDISPDRDGAGFGAFAASINNSGQVAGSNTPAVHQTNLFR